MNLEGLVAVAFLDVHGRFAKDEDAVVEVRLWYDANFPGDFVTLTRVTFDALTLDERTTIRNAGSGAGLIDTAHKSNA